MTATLKANLTNALTSYATSKVYLEDIVDSAGYTTVIGGLIDLSNTSRLSDLEQPSNAFLSALSQKSKGLLLTSALLTDNKALYSPLYDAAAKDVSDLYSQDLTTLLGGNQAHAALFEMTKRACHDTNELEHFSAGLSRISAAVDPDKALAEVKSQISESCWVETNRSESRDFLTIVNAAPAELDLGTLKDGPLSRFLKTGMKLGTVAAVVIGVGMTSLYGGGFAHKASTIGLVDLQARPTIETMVTKDQVTERKIIEYGEIDGPKLMAKYASVQIRTGVKGIVENYTDPGLTGVASITKPGEVSNEALCIVDHHQNAPVTRDGNFYQINNYPQLVVDKNLADFLVKSHETGHCFFQIDNSASGARQLTQLEGAYNQSLEEVFGDLVATLDYMRETGTNDLYTNFLRPMRVSSVPDLWHKTAWALDEIFKQVDPAAIHLKSKEEIPQIAKYLIEKNFMAKDGSFYPGEGLYVTGADKLDTPAVKALWGEINAARKMIYKRYHDPAVKQLGDDIQATMSAHYARYNGVAPKTSMASAMVGYETIKADFKLEPIVPVKAQQAQVSKPLDSMMNAFL